MQLTGYKRTILKSRVRRHPKVDATRAAMGLPADLSKLRTPDLIQLAHALGIACPSDLADAAYRDKKESGAGARAAMAAADAADGPTGVAAATDEDEAHEADATDEAQDEAQDDAPAATPAATPAPAQVDPIEAAAADAVRAVLAPMGAGNMAGFQAALQALAIKAVTPPPPAPVIYADPSKVRGIIPKVVGRRDMKAAGITALQTARLDATALDVYDAPDAPPVDPRYTWPEAFTAPALAALGRGRNVFLYGPAGTGKTTFAEQIAARWGRPFVRISCDDQTEAATLVGMTVPDGNGGVKWQDGQLTAAIRRAGTVILLDEPSVARAGALMVMQGLLDGARALTIQETGERVPVAAGVLFIAADNTNGTGDETGAYEGTRRLNRAFLDRYAVTFRLDYMPPAMEAQVIAKASGLKPAHALAVAKFAALTRTGAQKGEVSHGLGIRRLFALGEMIADGVDPTLALQVTVIETAPFEDREPLRQLWTAHVNGDTFK